VYSEFHIQPHKHCRTGRMTLVVVVGEQLVALDLEEAIREVASVSQCNRHAERSKCASSLHCLDRLPQSLLSGPFEESLCEMRMYSTRSSLQAEAFHRERKEGR